MTQTSSAIIRTALLAPLIGLVMVITSCGKSPEATVVKQIDWSAGNKWMIADLHSHTKFSDGALTVGEVAKQAQLGGCDVLAITDHTDIVDAGSDAYFDAIENARRDIKSMLLIAGLEWNIPPYGGREHVSVLAMPNFERRLKEFRSLFQGGDATAHNAFDWIAKQPDGLANTLAIYNHPGRKVDDLVENAADYLTWTARYDILIGFEGSPGHMRDAQPGSYRNLFKTIDHWDPIVAEIGGIWDTLLDQGRDPFAALAFSDFHNAKLDYPPCTFSKTHLLVPERTAEGVFAALRAGSFWAGHGGVLKLLRFEFKAHGLIIPAISGEVVELDADARFRVSVTLEREVEFTNSTLVAELIGNGKNGRPELLGRRELRPPETTVDWTFAGLSHAEGTAYFRLRVLLERHGQTNYVAYTNAIRVNLR